MKFAILVLLSIIIVSNLAAITFDYDGVLRTRAAFYNKADESTGGHIDNRLRMGMNSELAPKLKFRTRLQFGNVKWGDAAQGGGINAGVNISAYELYLDYRMDEIAANVRVGQQYWVDPMSLIIDGSFSGVMLTIDDLIGFKTEMAVIKGLEAGNFDDDKNYYLLNMSTTDKLPWGILASVYQMGDTNDESCTFMPHVNLKNNLVQVKAAAYAVAHFNSPEDDKYGIGGAIKAKTDVGKLNLGANILFATENGLCTLFPYHMNGLYIYGIGLYNDSVNLYWKTPYSKNKDSAISAVGTISTPVMNNCKLFAAAGYLKDEGYEVNAGIEKDVIPKRLKIVGFSAAGKRETNKIYNFVAGTSAVVTF